MKQRYWVVKDGYGNKLHYLESKERLALGDRDLGEMGWFTLFLSAEDANKALELSIEYYSDVPIKMWKDWVVEEFVP